MPRLIERGDPIVARTHAIVGHTRTTGGQPPVTFVFSSISGIAATEYRCIQCLTPAERAQVEQHLPMYRGYLTPPGSLIRRTG